MYIPEYRQPYYQVQQAALQGLSQAIERSINAAPNKITAVQADPDGRVEIREGRYGITNVWEDVSFHYVLEGEGDSSKQILGDPEIDALIAHGQEVRRRIAGSYIAGARANIAVTRYGNQIHDIIAARTDPEVAEPGEDMTEPSDYGVAEVGFAELTLADGREVALRTARVYDTDGEEVGQTHDIDITDGVIKDSVDLLAIKGIICYARREQKPVDDVLSGESFRLFGEGYFAQVIPALTGLDGSASAEEAISRLQAGYGDWHTIEADDPIWSALQTAAAGRRQAHDMPQYDGKPDTDHLIALKNLLT